MEEKYRRLEVLYRIHNALVHYIGPNGLVYSIKNRIFMIKDLENPYSIKLGEIPWRGNQLISHIRLADRALKNSILQVHEAANHGLLTCNGHSWWLITPEHEVISLSSFCMNSPLSRGICTSSTGITFIAEYIPNNLRLEPIRIFRSKDFCSFEVAWEFPPGAIRHVHALVTDPEDRRRIWVLTGDRDSECHILYTDDEFKSLHVFLSEGQKTRATDLIVCDGDLMWGMDSPLETPYLLCASKKKQTSVRKILMVTGPVYYMTRNQAGAIYFGTTVEPGPAVEDQFGRIFGSLPDQEWEEILRRRNDPFPQHGIFYFPRGILPENYLVYSQRALFPQEGQMTVARDLAWASRP